MIGRHVIRLANGRYWVSDQESTGNIDIATKFDSAMDALRTANRVGQVLHMASIIPYFRPSERIKLAEEQEQILENLKAKTKPAPKAK
jgi:hypothetical protein